MKYSRKANHGNKDGLRKVNRRKLRDNNPRKFGKSKLLDY